MPSEADASGTGRGPPPPAAFIAEFTPPPITTYPYAITRPLTQGLAEKLCRNESEKLVAGLLEQQRCTSS
jgi:hypothetical protein